MTPCHHDQRIIHAYADGELDATNTADAEVQIATCPDCAAELESVLALRGVLRAPGARTAAPSALRRRLLSGKAPSSIGQTAAPNGRPRARGGRRRPPWVFPVAVAGVFTVVGLAAIMTLMITPSPANGTLTDDLIADHVRSLQVEHLVDVETSDRHVVKPWFNGKLDFSPPVVDLKDKGFPLAGGRMDYANHRAVAALVYRRGEHVINLFVWPEPGEATSGPVQTRDGYTVRHWRGSGMGFWAVSDVNPDDLSQFETDFKAKAPASAPPPPPENDQD